MVYAVFVQSQWTVRPFGLVSGIKPENNYYLDNHKKDTTIEYWWIFEKIYIDYERQAYLWVQLNLDEVQKYFSRFPGIKEWGYLYVDADKGVDMVKFHINDYEELIYLIKVTHYGGFLSVRYMEVQIPVMNIYHDECIFKQ